MTTQPDITLTPDEAALVADLMRLYHAAYADANHRQSCECAFCRAIAAAGERSYRVFDALAEKVGTPAAP